VAVLRAQSSVFGLVASDPTVSRLIVRLAEDADGAVAAISAARAAARQRVWGLVGAPTQDGTVVMDLDATLIDAHSEKQDASRTWKKGSDFTRCWGSSIMAAGWWGAGGRAAPTGAGGVEHRR
jgi:putative SOS response-associated peptidase YedK